MPLIRSSSTLAKFEMVAAIVSFALIFVCGLARMAALRLGVEQKTADLATRCCVLLLFFVFGFSAIGLMLHVFVVLQRAVGNTAAPMVRFLAAHETGVTLALWGFMGIGVLIALPVMLTDLAGLQLPILRSRGVLVADIGMTISEVKARSTLKMKEPRLMGDGSYLGVEEAVFDYRIGNSAVAFPESRYYWLQTPKGDTHIDMLNVGISPRKMSNSELETFRHKLQQDLLADGWMPGHYVARSEETVRLWGGKRTAGDGRFWAKGNTVLIFETKRLDEEKRDEPAGSGEFILYIDLRPRDFDAKLVFERSAWPN